MPGPGEDILGDLAIPEDELAEMEQGGDLDFSGMKAADPDVSSVRSDAQHVAVRRRIPLDREPPERFTDPKGREWRLKGPKRMELPETQVQGETPEVAPASGGMATMAAQARDAATGAPANPTAGMSEQETADAVQRGGTEAAQEGYREVWYEPVPEDTSDEQAIRSAMSSPAAQLSPFNQPIARVAMPDPEQRHAFASGVADIGAMGWLDEIAAKLSRETGQSEEEARQQAEEFFRGVEQRHGTEYTAGQATGLAGLMAAPGAAGGARGLGALSRAGAAEGAVYGTVAGAGEAPPGQRAEGAAFGGSLGAAAGGAAPVVMRGASKVSQPVREWMARKVPELRRGAASRRIASAQPAGGISARDLHNIEKTFPGGEGVEGAARVLDEAGVFGRGLRQRALSSSEDVARRAQEVRDRAGAEIGEILDAASRQADEVGEAGFREASPPGTVIGDDLAQQIQARVIDPIEQGAGQYVPAQTRALKEPKRVVERLRGKGPMDARELQEVKQSLAESIRFDRISASPSPLGTERMRGVYGTVRDVQEEAIDEAGRALDDPEMLARLQRAKKQFGATDRVAEMAEDFGFREAARREISPSDYGVGFMGGSMGGAGGEGAMAGGFGFDPVLAIGAAGVNKLLRGREKALTATGREGLANTFERAAQRQLPAGTRAGRLEGTTGAIGSLAQPATAEAQAPEDTEMNQALYESTANPVAPGRAIVDAIEGNPDALGQYAEPLQQAYQSGGDQAVQARHFILQQRDPEYRRLIRQMQDPDQEQSE